MKSMILKALSGLFLAAFVVAVSGAMAKGGCPMKGMDMGKGMKACQKGCPMMIEGAETKVEKTKDGVVITITSKDKKTIEAIQKAAESCQMAAKAEKEEGEDKDGKDGKEGKDDKDEKDGKK